jgi:hypothetical protein
MIGPSGLLLVAYTFSFFQLFGVWVRLGNYNYGKLKAFPWMWKDPNGGANGREQLKMLYMRTFEKGKHLTSKFEIKCLW